MTSIQPFGAVSEADLAAFESQIGFALPTDYRTFLQETNGGVVENQVFFVPDVQQDVLLHVLYGVNYAGAPTLNLAYWLKEFGDEIHDNSLLIGSDPGGGFILYVTAGEDQGVYYWDDTHFFPQSSEEDGNTCPLADSFTQFLGLLREYEPA